MHRLLNTLLSIKTLLNILFILILISFSSIAYFTNEERLTDEQWEDFQQQLQTRLQLIAQVREHFGYGGIIHHFKNYLLRQQASYRERFEQSFTQLQATLAQYKTLPNLTIEETKTINEIIEVAEKYNKNIGVITELLQANQTIPQIDAIVKIDDSPALSALNTITMRFRDYVHQQSEQLEQQVQLDRYLVFANTIIMTIIVSIFLVWFIRHLTWYLSKTVSIANNIATGNLDNTIDTIPHNEIGQLLQSLAHMQSQLRERFAQDKQIAERALRINRALDWVTTSILITDNDYKIIYINETVQRLFQAQQDEIRQKIPSFDATQLLGNKIEVFHTDPTHQYQLLSQLVHSHHATITIGKITLDHIITPIINDAGKRLGLVIEFRDRSLEVATEKEINQVIQAASQGDFQQRINLEDKTGFFKTFSEGLNQIMDFTQSAVGDIMRIAAALATGDLSQKIDTHYVGAFHQLKNDINITVDKLTEIMTSISQAAAQVNQTANEISQSNVSLNQRTEQQAASLEETAASMEQMTGTVQQNADNAKHATQVAVTAKERAEKGGEVIGSTIQAITEINHSSQKITDIIGVIDDIAFQTNLLALNAAVEAARAGEQGRGFAVVAAEVRSLAQRSATAAKKIKQLIEDSVIKVQEGTQLAHKSGETLKDIVIAVKQVSDIIAEIAAASQEQSSGIQQVNKAIVQMDETTQQNAAMVEEMTSTTQAMSEQASDLQKQVAFFKRGQFNLTPELKNSVPINRPVYQPTVMPIKSFNVPVSKPDVNVEEWEDF
jgi:methyl-accepting chemotaxis protein